MVKKKVFSIGRDLSQGLEDTIESAQTYSSELRIDIIPIKKIELDPQNPREFFLTEFDIQFGINEVDEHRERKLTELESLQSIAHSIKTQGMINPITVYKHQDKYRLIAGERRTLASLLAGKKDIQAKILDDKPEALQISLWQWIENMERSDLTLQERLNNLEKIVHAYCKEKAIKPSQITITELSQLLGCVKSHAMNYKTILFADNDIKQMIIENKIKNLEKAAIIADMKIPELRIRAMTACLNGCTLKQLKQIAKQTSFKVIPHGKDNRGRKSKAVDFGYTNNPRVARIVIESILNHNVFPLEIINQYKHLELDYRSLSTTFKHLMKLLETLNIEN